ncbi:hypothetical protein IH970_15080, partial [candidate division KSB1 bacterium]|nr:hypothetical protein [candidate division KSB1 bacterium]
VVICLSGSSPAQEEIFSLGMQLGTGARAIAMGGAYTSVGGDFSASFWNPAALADIRRVEFYGSLSHLMRQIQRNFLIFHLIQPLMRMKKILPGLMTWVWLTRFQLSKAV